MPELKRDKTPKAPWELVAVGDPVLWYLDGDAKLGPCPAVVTGIGPGLCLNILSKDSFNMRIRDGVPHVSDPRCGSDHMRDAGGWDFSPLARRLAALEEAVSV